MAEHVATDGAVPVLDALRMSTKDVVGNDTAEQPAIPVVSS